jgi:hypothetical protein
VYSAIGKVDTDDFTEKTLVAPLRNGYTHDVSLSAVRALTKKKDKNNAEALIIKMETGRAYHGIKTNFYKEEVGAHGTISATTLEVCATLQKNFEGKKKVSSASAKDFVRYVIYFAFTNILVQRFTFGISIAPFARIVMMMRICLTLQKKI